MSTKDIIYVSLFAAIVAALGLFPPFPLPLIGVPITAQSMGPMLSGSILGAKRGAFAILLFLTLVGAGLPLLAGGRGGIGMFFGPTGGFLLGWPISAFTIGWLCERFWEKLNFVLAAAFMFIGGVAILYPIGALQVSFVMRIPYSQALMSCLPFLFGDMAKVLVASSISLRECSKIT